ncbi:hypothetical protein HOY34_18910 [Xinfangfangia sp. D13-10-4-6]|uniref:hypothetical protein n=1 Tax=Pseudogemmobacter hezensis TaxID=2737662 RepID=UPI001551D845|nr:hypothetical protein [Pseudogemmobacter hezensis]NPD17265.1 hypothetical protein [Pseudogemmobacter hezensis]
MPWLHKYLCKDQGIGMMFTDSQIVERVIKRCTDSGLPVLTVHDSVFAPYTHSRLVNAVMVQAAEEAVGRPLPLEAEHAGLDDVRDKLLEIQQDFQWWREAARCEGYLQRLKAWEGSHGQEVVSLGMKQRKARAG